MPIDETPRTDSPITGDDGQSGLCFGDYCFPNDAIGKWEIEEHMEGSQIVKTSSAVVIPPTEARWDYHAETELTAPKGLRHRGICVGAKRNQDGHVEFVFHGASWEYERSIIRGINIFGMAELEIAYWLPLLTGLAHSVEMPGLALDEELRPFAYAVPLKGLTSNRSIKSFFVGDFGVTSGDEDNIFRPILPHTEFGMKEAVWQDNVPKAWGVVLAHNLLEAERLSLDRARFTADLIGFALRAGISHFETRYEAEPLVDWNADVSRTVVALEPWIMLREVNVVKGWIHTVPLTEHQLKTDLEDGFSRIKLFAERFLDASKQGDIQEQAGRRTLSPREERLSSGIQRCLKWLGVASSEVNVSDQFLATWISLESILNAVDYPSVFGGERESARTYVEEAITSMNLPRRTEEPLTMSEELLRNRLLQAQWPLRTKLALFAKAFGVELKPDDSMLLGDLARLRNQVLHAGTGDPLVPGVKLRKLQYLVERLVAAASVYGYEDLEETSWHQLQFGEVGTQGGAAPLYLNGQEVPYRFRFLQDQGGQQVEEFVIEGKIYSSRNSELSFINEQ